MFDRKKNRFSLELLTQSALLIFFSGFTSWCSEREPCLVFQLLEAIFFAFDTLAKTLKVYKIETIGVRDFLFFKKNRVCCSLFLTNGLCFSSFYCRTAM